MSDLKKLRNDRMLAYYNEGKSIYWIAKRFKRSWSRTKRILVEHQARADA